ncbi:hypothetical protein Mtc_0392 [Methanocella conradii HZ254]|uniref:Uncharacterized protein n=1 Tax=Methanocella conradii (strain DSM 24694 / JCM 17849 / CGMCC 1.5162 / HZ254) TaxID=1041930 RepID=H8IA96_METCZ|nr:hypothetical protein [Methanocella conradii]AFC99162.1 hypothetical protein Mtc_0392 [Methanocella conradii HZ254]
MLTQKEADDLFRLLKRKKNNEAYEFPLPGELLVIPIISNDEGHEFLIDVNRRQITQMKCTYQERYQKTIILTRLDINGPPHNNPAANTIPVPYLEQYNGKTINCPHFCIEGYMNKWAIPMPSDKFSNPNDLYNTLQEFFAYCNVVDRPRVNQIRRLDEYQ